MDSKNVTVLIWDDPENFGLDTTQRSFGDGKIFKALKQFCSEDEFTKIMDEIEEDDQLVFCCHVRMNGFDLYEKFIYSGIEKKYNIPNIYYLSSNANVASDKFKAKFNESEKIMFYNNFITKINAGEIKTFTKNTIMNRSLSIVTGVSAHDEVPQMDYVIITALEEDEMTQLLKIIEKEGEVVDKKLLIEYGHLINNIEKKIAYVSQPTTGMVDAGIVATKMLLLFKPKFIIMAGVLGGKPSDAQIGDIIVSTKVFTIDKGKITEEQIKKIDRVMQYGLISYTEIHA